jgi:hypothetical protein
LIKHSKKEHWWLWTEEIDEVDVWVANRMVNVPYGDGGKVRLLDLKVQKANSTADVYESNSSKVEILHKGFFPAPSGGIDGVDSRFYLLTTQVHF